MMDVSINKRLVKKLGDTLDSLPASDYNGLKSQGLTCYLNSVLQVLFMTKDFRDAVEKSCSKNTITSHLARLFKALERTVTTTHAMVKILDITDVYEQRDAAEYLEKILCQTSKEASKIFQGELFHTIKCLECKDENHSHSDFWMLPIPMADSKQTYDVEKGLKDFFKVQNFSSDNKLYCTNCKKKQDAAMKCEITKPPGVLTLLLKRFTFDYKQRRYAKLHCKAVMPKTLYVKECRYELYAVVNHYGSLTGGHYTADIKSFETGQWYCFNDDIVRSLTSQPFGAKGDYLSSSTAYLLIYRKVNEEHEQADGRDLETEKRHHEAKRGESPKPLSGGLEAEMSCDHHVHRLPVNMIDQSGAVTRRARSPQDNKNCNSQITNKLNPQGRSSRQTVITQRPTSTRLRNNTKCEGGLKQPWR